MSDASVAEHLDKLRRETPEYQEIVERVREIVRAVAPDVTEKVMYGGLMFAAPVQFCGVFAYSDHVSLEFSRGFEFEDPHGVLEGSGKLRRHIKLYAGDDVDAKRAGEYVAQAYEHMTP